MILPNKFRFHTVSQGNFVYMAEQIDEFSYRIYWGPDPKRVIHAGTTTYDASFMKDAFARKVWTMANIETNEEALTLLNND